MTGARRRLLVGSMIMGLADLKYSTFAATSGQAISERVRPTNATIATLIQNASDRSPIFRGLIDTINASDGIVYIEPGMCGHGMRACFVKVTMAGATRMLWVTLDARGIDCDLMGLLGHELRHTVEVLGDPGVTNTATMYFFYRQNPDSRSGGHAFETNTAVNIGEAVRDQVRKKSRCSKVR